MTIPVINHLAQVRKLSEMYPERRAEQVYWDYLSDEPGDLAGSAFFHFEVGIPLEQNGDSVLQLNWLQLGFGMPTGPQMEWLRLIQEEERRGATWGEAVAFADAIFPFPVQAA